ncbi:arabinofuranosidase catalytic domain-containing protein [Fibrobacter sp. UWB12]|uniref:arabinofuranosidase catalytic domain-containing protein n=1 Tax=Fibrobacter sp. UWB12 TaxID=1896203 RepID=UPI00091A6AF8|nr:arabinofuranosidase catalytic domain-containing protein [Fibrobacter sp. UWB12]SHK22695.1 Carbohydrate binding module (family 6) [Fibrobacter sp. UWB12]
MINNTLTSVAAFVVAAAVSQAIAEGPCDIYAKAKTPCVAAHSLTRALYSSYNGNLYQVRRADGETKDIPVETMGGYVKSSVQDDFCAGSKCTISIIYDQSSYKNDLKKSPPVFWLKEGGREAIADRAPIYINGRKAYGFYRDAWSSTGYRNNETKGVATGDEEESMYMVVDGRHYNDMCCFNYGNAETTGNDDGPGTMECIYFGDDKDWGGPGQGTGPWVAADLEDGVFKGNDAGYMWGRTHTTPWPDAQTIDADYATAMLKGPNDGTFKLKGGSAQEGKLTTMWDGPRKQGYSPRKLQGAIVLGNGGDGSDGGAGTFFEGCMTIGNPPDSIDDKVQANIVAAGYGSKIELKKPDPIEPFKDTLTIPGKIEAENYDKGGNGQGFLDSDIENENSLYRDDNAGLDSAEGAIIYGWGYADDWLRYTVKASKNDSLTLTARVASPSDSTFFSVLVDEKNVATVMVPNTGDWKKFETVTVSVPAIAEGAHVLKIKIDKPYFNLDWIEFAVATSQTESIKFTRQAAASQVYTVYDVLGNRVTSFQANENAIRNIWDKVRINMPGGIYVIKTMNKTIRISNIK